MLLAPSRTKYRRQHRGRMKALPSTVTRSPLAVWVTGSEPCDGGSSNRVGAYRLTRFMKRGGKCGSVSFR
jgi:hypothetical protein